MPSFVHLHTHTHYSLLDGANRISDLAETAFDYNMPALAMTDHGNMFGAVEFYKTMKSANVKPIIGCELYVAPGSRFEKKPPRAGDRSAQTTHLVVLAKNATGYRNLMKLSSAGYLEGFYYKPRVDLDLLEKHSEGLIALSACAKGVVANHVVGGQMDKAREKTKRLREIFDGNLYLEMQDHGLDFDKPINNAMIDFSKEFDLPLVATNDAHYLNREDSAAQDVLVCIQTGKELADPKRLKFATDQLYFKTAGEMSHMFGHVSGAIENTVKIAEMIDFEMELDNLKHPQVPVPDGYKNLAEYLHKLSYDGLKERYSVITEELTARLDYELGVINQMGYPGYFLIVADFVRFAREAKIPVMARGSAVGCLVAYTLGITNVDPIGYGLLFERFLNPERVSMPDIDIDLADRERDKVINYVIEKYGKQSVAQIITFGTMAAKAAIRDVGRVLGMSYGEVDHVAKLVPTELKMTIDKAMDQVPELKQVADSGGNEGQLIGFAKTLEGLARHASVHAAGVVIAPGDLTDYVPLYKPSNKDDVVTQYTGDYMEEVGLLKMDFLGLRNLSVIQDAIAMIKENTGDEIDLEEIPLDDQKTFDLFCRGDTAGIFQFNSSWLFDYLRRLQPSAVEDLIAMNALCRPGPLYGGVVDDYIDRKNGRKEVVYLHPVLEKSLKETYGLIVYQEQAMQIARDMAGYTLGRADILRKAMGKKSAEVMAAEKRDFIGGSVANGIDQKIAEEIFDLIEYFAGYAFNKSHSAAYGIVAYQEGFMKAHYPREFMAALMSNEMSNSDEIVMLINECRKMGLTVLPPDVNTSQTGFVVEGDGIRFGLCAIKNVGLGAVQSIINARNQFGKFNDLYDMCENIELRLANKRVLDSLIQSGACDSLNGHRAQLLEILESAIDSAQSLQNDRDKGQTSLFDVGDDDENQNPMIHRPPMPTVQKWPTSQALVMEKEMLGFYVSGHPLAQYADELRGFATTEMKRLDQVRDIEEDVVVGGIITEIKPIVDRKGKSMAFITLEDFTGAGEVLVFSSEYELHKAVMNMDSLILVRGQISVKDDDRKVVAAEVMSLEDARDKLSRSIHVRIVPEQSNEATVDTLKETLTAHPGDCDVVFTVRSDEHGEVAVKAGEKHRVSPTQSLLTAVRKVVGTENARLRAAPLKSNVSGWTGYGSNRPQRNGRWNGNGNGNDNGGE
ncbi:MAG: DNA polymerase III subunit alpha [Candidatus Latescibacteria bacterium]|jgi:DNA polymerase III subunit alpha|nr:DNA polymerase III subunit alpha [Candidatus Latescibacterota bacterium]